MQRGDKPYDRLRARIPAVVMATLAGLGLASPAGANPPGPAAPTDLDATNGSSSVMLAWSQPGVGTRPVSFRVYEGSTVVARNTTTHVTVPNLGFGSTHTYRVTAVDRVGRESAPSAPVTRQVFIGGAFACGITAPGGLVATEATSSAVSLSWSNAIPSFDQQGTLVVLQDSAEVLETTLDSARIGGLAPATTYTFTVARRDCMGGLHPGTPVTVTTAAGDTARPASPTGLTLRTRTASSITLAWTRAGDAPAAVRYTVFEGGDRVATTASTSFAVSNLWRDTAHQYTVAALNAAGDESAHSAPVSASTLPCPDGSTRPGTVNPPTGLTATAMSSSTIALSWAQEFEATSFTVYRVASEALPLGPVVTTHTASAVVTGLPPDTSAGYAVVAETAACGRSGLSTPTNVSTPPGPAARPTAPTDLRMASAMPNLDFTGTVTLAWTEPAGDDSAVSYRLYEGATPFATSTTPGITLRLPGGPTHSVTAVAVDAAGNESAQSPPLVFTVPFIPPP